ncbi:rab-protein geranylgeranyltransferase [Rhodocollybia butyracea]|uniref:Geranylgeranyl transferase type-2 subunit alpha n=1 Tax=Rhodocollybia butyracea TaxID=206335 RepID=A0A9P5UBC5_9AGAR|nr:rab-protein geranylgeranyltransferase [Rhodocollybia butyracea]
MSHGVRRVLQNKEALEAKKLKDQSKIRDYITLTSDVLNRKKQNDWSSQAFQLTTELLQVNPEFYTIWNYRRRILLNGIIPQSTPEQIRDILAEELSMTMAALKVHPKVYWIWNHRGWCLDNVPSGPGTEQEGDPRGWEKGFWDRELFVVEKMLDADPRNFHAWSYRRIVLANMPIPKPLTAELAYTTRKIEANFSNFSAWHQRSKVLSSLWSKGELDSNKSKEEGASGILYHEYISNSSLKEFDLVHNAMYTDPYDQSVWIYHRWLIGSGDDKDILEREIEVIQSLLEEESGSKWCMESLVHYKRLLLSNHASTTDTSTLKRDCMGLLRRLLEVDPSRRARYEEIELEIARL